MTVFGETANRPVTFAKAGSGRSFVEKLYESSGKLASEAVTLSPYAYRSALNSDLSNSRDLLEEQYYDGLIDTVKRVSGVTLPNPKREFFDPRANESARFTMNISAGRQRFDEELQSLIASNPALKDAVATAKIDFSPDMIARRSVMDLEANMQGKSLTGQITGSLAGGVGAIFRDPVQLALMFASGGESTAVTALGRVASVMLREALVNAAGTALIQPVVQENRNRLGLESGIGPALDNIAIAGLAGGVFGGVAGGAGEFLRAFKGGALTAPEMNAIENVFKGTANAREIDQALGALNIAPDEKLVKEIETLKEMLRDAETLDAARPAGIAGADHQSAIVQAIRHAEDPIRTPPPDVPLPVPQTERIASLPDTMLPGMAHEVMGRPVTFRQISSADIGTDAASFQYKGGGDQSGVTDRLRSVEQWDPMASGKAMVFERADGSLVIADGHQRLGLAKSISAKGQDAPRLDAFVFRESDGWTPREIRAIAAKKNIQEGSGTSIDTARVLRDMPELFDKTLPVNSPTLRQARSLAALSDEAWGMVLNEIIPPHYAAHIGAMAPDRPELHASLVKDVLATDPANDIEARFAVSQALSAGTIKEVQETLFGKEEMTRSLFGERSKVFGEAVKILGREKQAFKTLLNNQEIVERVGNKIEAEATGKAMSQADLVAALLEKLANRSGFVSDALNRAAAALAEGQQRTKVARVFITDVLNQVEKSGLAGLEAGPDRLQPLSPVEPMTPEAGQLADDLTLDMFGAEARIAPETGFKGDQVTLDDAARLTDHADLIDVCKG